MRSKNRRRQAAYALQTMAYFRVCFSGAKLHPETWRGLPRSFCMDPAGRRDAFESWRERHRAIVARMEPLP